MKSVIICEGYSDLTLIQYFMEVVNEWQYEEEITGILKFSYARRFKKDNDTLFIGEVNGNGNIQPSLYDILQINVISPYSNERFNNVVVICDRDEEDTEKDFANILSEQIRNLNINIDKKIQNNEWVNCTAVDPKLDSVNFRILLLIIPFEETGALETFLLDALSEKDEYDKHIISNGNNFVDTVDTENRYLSKRRYRTKAKFDVYFSIRTPLEQFQQRREILRGIAWEKYEAVQRSFIKLRELG